MQFVLNNPYRILGLVNPVTNKELTKRTSDLGTFIEFGKPINYPLDFEKVDSLNRTNTLIQESSQKIESDSEKLFHALFWFYQYDAVDDMAFDYLKKGDVKIAYSLWSQQIKKTNTPKFSWLINISVLDFFRLNARAFNKEVFEQLIEHYGELLCTQFDNLKLSLFNQVNVNIDAEQIGKKVIDSLIGYIANNTNADYGIYSLDLLYHFNNYPDYLQEYVEAKLLSPCITEIDNAIQKSKTARENEDTSQIYDKNGLGDVEYLITELDYHSDNYKVQNIINEYAEEAKYCSVFAFNVLEDSELAQELIVWADELPAYGSISDEISEKRIELEKICRNNEQFEKFQPIIDIIEQPILSVQEAENRIIQYKNALEKVRNNNVSINDDLYIGISSRCVHNIINFCINVNNESFENFERNKNVQILLNNQVTCKNLLESVRYFTQDSDTQQRRQESLKHINEQITQIQQASNGQVTTTQNRALVKQKESSPEVWSGVFYSIGTATGINVNALRVIYTIGTVSTGIWPGIVLYFILAFLKNIFQQNKH